MLSQRWPHWPLPVRAQTIIIENMEKFEYKIITLDAKTGLFRNKAGSTDQEVLNELGADGWKLVAVTPVGGTSIKSYGGATTGFVYHLKRRLSK